MKTFLLIIDMQEGFLSKDTEKVRERICTLIEQPFFDFKVATIYQNTPDSPLVKIRNWDRFFSGKEQRLEENVEKCSDAVVFKQKYSAFNEQLISILKNNNGGELPQEIFIAGIDTECCVLATALELFEYGIRPIVLADYCGTTAGKEFHDAGLVSMSSLIGGNNIYRGEIESKEEVKKIPEICKKNMEIKKKL